MKLKNRRIKKGLTQKELAEKANITVVSYQRLEYGKQTPSLKTAKLIAKALDCNIEDIF